MILVTGVHRSGTSLLALTMRSLGADFGPSSEFYEADRWNQNGYLERRDVMDINSRIVTGFPRSSGGVSGLASKVKYLMMPSDDRIRRRGRRLRSEVSSLAESLESLTVKDPRFCLTLPEWTGTGVVESVVVAVRSPYEVAQSLNTRQNIPVGVGLRFWAYHMRALLEAVPEASTFIDHAVLAGPEPLLELSKLRSLIGLQLTDEQLEASFNEVFVRELRHEKGPASVRLPAEIDELWRRVRRRLMKNSTG